MEMQLLSLFIIFKRNVSAINTFICSINDYWFIFLGVTANMDSTNLSANQASYPLISPDGVNSIRAPKKENWTAIRETIFCLIC